MKQGESTPIKQNWKAPLYLSVSITACQLNKGEEVKECNLV